MKLIRIIPRPGAVVRDPDQKGAPPLPPEGKLVPIPTLSPYWRRRLREGGISISILSESPTQGEEG